MRTPELPPLERACDSLAWMVAVARYRGDRPRSGRCPSLPALRAGASRLEAPESLRVAWRAGIRPYRRELLEARPGSTTFAEMFALQRRNSERSRAKAAKAAMAAEAERPALIRLPQGGDQVNLLYSGAADADGEYPVLGLDLDGHISLKYASVAHFVVEYLLSELPSELRVRSPKESDVLFHAELVSAQNRVQRALRAEASLGQGFVLRRFELPRRRPVRAEPAPVKASGSRLISSYLRNATMGTATDTERDAARAAAVGQTREQSDKLLMACWKKLSEDKAAAAVAFDVALRSPHAEPRFFNLYFTALLEMGRAEESLELVERCLVENGKNQWVALQGTLRVAGALGDRKLAERAVARATELGFDVDGWLGRGEFASARRVLGRG